MDVKVSEAKVGDAKVSTDHPIIMGIVNVTPDSFSDGGRSFDTRQAIEHALCLFEEGAHVVDIGGESTRPPGRDYGTGSAGVDLREELRRVVPVIEGIIAARPESTISIDTVKPEVAEAALAAGATIINDVSAGQYDERIWEVAADGDATYVLMHGHNPHERRPVEQIVYTDVIAEVYAFLSERIERCREAGIEKIVADVGIGFSKGAADSTLLIREHRRFALLGVPLLVGASRKSFVGRALNGAPVEDRLFGSLGAHAAAVVNGAAIVRVHDVRATVEFFRLFLSLVNLEQYLLPPDVAPVPSLSPSELLREIPLLYV